MIKKPMDAKTMSPVGGCTRSPIKPTITTPQLQSVKEAHYQKLRLKEPKELCPVELPLTSMTCEQGAVHPAAEKRQDKKIEEATLEDLF